MSSIGSTSSSGVHVSFGATLFQPVDSVPEACRETDSTSSEGRVLSGGWPSGVVESPLSVGLSFVQKYGY